jgi:hypothetical protein
MKAFPSPDGAEKELAKLEREKRKKGYLDEGSSSTPPENETDGETEDEADHPPMPSEYTLEADGRSVELSLALEGKSVRTTVIERYPTDKAAGEAFRRLSEGMEAEGYRRKR